MDLPVRPCGPPVREVQHATEAYLEAPLTRLNDESVFITVLTHEIAHAFCPSGGSGTWPGLASESPRTRGADRTTLQRRTSTSSHEMTRGVSGVRADRISISQATSVLRNL